MAKKNRDEAITQINAKIVPVVTNNTHKDLLNNDIVNSTVFERDVIDDQAPSGGNVTITYTDKDLARVTTTTNLTVSFTGLENGAVKHLFVTKNAGNSISFSGATDVSAKRSTINANSGNVVYRVTNKNNIVFVECISQSYDFTSEVNANSSAISTNAGNIATNTGNIATNAGDIAAIESDLNGQELIRIAIGTWNMDSQSFKIVNYTPPAGKWFSVSDVLIRNDSSSALSNSLIHKYTIGSAGGTNVTVHAGGVDFYNATYIELNRSTGGYFDSTSYDSTAFNRGYIVGQLFNI